MGAEDEVMIAREFLRYLFEDMVASLVERVLAPNRRTATLRRLSILLSGGILWAVIAFRAHPYTPNLDGLRNFLEYPFRSLFAADIFKHILIGSVAFWVAYRTAAIYLDDIFELNNVRVAERFIRQSAFASRYDLIEIMDGKVAEKYKDSPIVLIGGPGKVRVYLENAALFEKIDGQPHIIAPTMPRTSQQAQSERAGEAFSLLRGAKRLYSLIIGEGEENGAETDGTCVLESFERLRSIIDLRDQVETTQIISRTRDGIPVRVVDLRVIFSILRGDQRSTLEQPYPFSAKAFETLVFTLPHQALISNLPQQINRWLGGFISRHTLGEFLAAIGPPEVQDGGDDKRKAAADAPGMDNVEGNGQSSHPRTNIPPFKSRPEIRDLFYDYDEFVKKAREKGVELRWIGLGTWLLPSSIIPEKHLRAWRLTQENLLRGSRFALDSLRRENRDACLAGIIRMCPLGRAQELDLRDELSWKRNMAHLTDVYIGKLDEALDVFKSQQQSDSVAAQRIRTVREHLARAVGRFLS